MAGRYAPSPTSDLHLGNLRTALLAWVFARRSGLRLLVRIEDLDQQRVGAARGVAQRQLDDLAAIGLDWSPPVVRQSDRLGLYASVIAGLDTYECFCTRREVAEAAQAPQASRPDAVTLPEGAYPGTCAHLSGAERARRRRERPGALRVRADAATVTVHDRFAGEVTGIVDDFVVARGDGTPAYNLATVVDDGVQGVTQVVRGDDLLGSSPRQAWLATQLGHPVPDYVHVGLAVNARGVRLAKRDGAVSLADLAALGHDAGEVRGWLLASLGLDPWLGNDELLRLPDEAFARANEQWVVDADEWVTP
ncbi:tRNA glutamyl-Q(34) synthetase GluQRS [Propionibacteriaceae bacterium G57]|uniref:tRNA glutamyl-Q(34) synthetase GluQRS n=1 Tax=Aestuariimicrobium sp. G57 TaxID=3418485 RepID=UPI003DA772F7